MTEICSSIFDAQTFQGWIQTGNWAIREDAIIWNGKPGQESVWSERDYGSFRLFLTMRLTEIVTPDSSHEAVLIWGKRPPAGVFGSAGFLSVIPPDGWLWSYKTNSLIETDFQGKDSPDPTQWHRVEIVANIKTGHILMAVNGVKMLEHTYKGNLSDLVPGPIGLQQHHDGVPAFKEIYMEENPAQDVLVSIKP